MERERTRVEDALRWIAGAALSVAFGILFIDTWVVEIVEYATR